VGGPIPPGLTARTLVLGCALAVPLVLRDAQVLLAPAGDGLRRVLARPPDVATALLLLAVAMGAAALLVRRSAPHAPWVPLLGLAAAALPLVPLLTGEVVVLAALQGPAVVLLALPLLAMALVRTTEAGLLRLALPAPRAPFMLLGAWLLFALLTLRLPGPAGAQGDEPHYLLMARSLASDGDLDLRDELEGREYAAFYAGTLHAHASPASPPGTVLPVHAPGLAALIAPAFELGGEAGVRLLMALLAAAAAAMAGRAVLAATGRPGAAWTAWALLVLTPPLPFYAVAIYPEVLGAFATAAFLLLARGAPGAASLAGAAATAATLPWMHPKFLPLAAGGLLLVALRPGRLLPRVLAALAALLSWATLLVFFQRLYGRASLSAAYGSGFADDVAVGRAPWGLLALLLDRQFGLLSVSPAWFLALPGAVLLWRLRPGAVLRAVVLAGLSAGVGASFSMWWGGSCPPARFLVPALPALALLAVEAAARRPRVAAALVGLGVAVVALAADAPRALHNRADAESGLLRHVAPQLDLDGFLPSFVAATDAEAGVRLGVVALALAILAAALAAWSGRRPAALVALAALAVTAFASRAPAPLLEPRLSTLQLLQAWDPDGWWSPQRVRAADDLAITLPLGDEPWTLTPGEIRLSRRLDLPPGTYRFEVEGSASADEPGARAVRLELVADEVLIEKLYLQAGGPTPTALVMLPVGARRLQLAAAAVQGRGRVTEARLRPVDVVPGPLREGLDWPRASSPDRYRAGEGVVRTTALDRSDADRGGFIARPGDRFVVDAPGGQPVEAQVEAPRGATLRWAERVILAPPGATRLVLTPHGPTLGRTTLVTVSVDGPAWLRFREVGEAP
jgi:hypothetical protein